MSKDIVLNKEGVEKTGLIISHEDGCNEYGIPHLTLIYEYDREKAAVLFMDMCYDPSRVTITSMSLGTESDRRSQLEGIYLNSNLGEVTGMTEDEYLAEFCDWTPQYKKRRGVN